MHLKKSLYCLLPLFSVVCFAVIYTQIVSAAPAQEIEKVSDFGNNPGALNMYKFVPKEIDTTSNRPLVMALHGCTQSVQDYVNATDWVRFAKEHDFYIIYPEQTSDNNPATCFNWAGEYGDETNLTRGQGENESLMQMIRYMQKNYKIDAKRIFITGFSAGGAMVPVMLSTWPDIFKAGASFAGIPFRCATSVGDSFSCMNSSRSLSPEAWGDLVRKGYPNYTGKYPKLYTWHGTSDRTVIPKNQTELIKQWANVLGIDGTADETYEVAGHSVSEYKDNNGNVQIVQYLIQGMGHAVPIDPGTNENQGGATGMYGQDMNIFSTYELVKAWKLDQISDDEDNSNGGNTDPVIVPIFKITTPIDNATLLGDVVVEIDVKNYKIDNIEFFLDKTSLGALPYNRKSDEKISFRFNSKNFNDGKYTLKAVGLLDHSKVIENQITVTISNSFFDNQPPTIEITAPQSSSTPLKGTVSITGKVSDNDKVTYVTLEIVQKSYMGSNTIIKTIKVDIGNDGKTFKYDLNTKELPNYSQFELQAKAYDLSGNISKTAVLSFMVVNY